MGDLRGHLPELIQARIDTARADGRTLFIELGATWCGPCLELEHNLTTSPMIDAFSDASVVHLDVNEWDVESDMGPLGIKGGVMPIIVAVDTTGHAVAQLNGVIDAAKIKAFIGAHRWATKASKAVEAKKSSS
jgi:thiol-disulfide isomerase/thioredoxin